MNVKTQKLQLMLHATVYLFHNSGFLLQPSNTAPIAWSKLSKWKNILVPLKKALQIASQQYQSQITWSMQELGGSEDAGLERASRNKSRFRPLSLGKPWFLLNKLYYRNKNYTCESSCFLFLHQSTNFHLLFLSKTPSSAELFIMKKSYLFSFFFFLFPFFFPSYLFFKG